jgi:hypothetical protein
MSGKSIDDILRQQAAQRQAQIQQQQAQERALNEQRERQRQEHIQRQRMYEKLSNFNPSAAAASSAGGSRPVGQQVDFPEVLGQSEVVTWTDESTDTFKIVVYNFTTGVLSDIIDTGLTYNSGNEWYVYSNNQHVQTKGFSIVYKNNVDSKYKIYFLNASGTLVAAKDLDTNRDFQYTENAQIFLGLLNDVSICYHFTGDNVRTHTFPDVDINLMDVDDASGEDVTKDGSVIIEAPNNGRYYIARPNGDLVEVTDYLLGNNGFRTDYLTDFIAAYSEFRVSEGFNYDTMENIKIISQEGELKNQMDFNEGAFEFSEYYNYGDNCAFWDLNNFLVSDRRIVSYDGDSNQFVSVDISGTNSAIFGRTKRECDNPYSSFGENLVVASYTSTGNDDLGYFTTELIVYWLPKGNSEFITHNLNLGTASFIDGMGINGFTDNRTFTQGENPLIMFGLTSSEIQIGFLTPTGFVTQSTGIQYSSCSNIWGHNIGDKSFAIFDITDGSRVWQIYDENSIIEETTTTSSWEFGTNSRESHRNGTLVVLDSGTTSNSFIYTTEIGLTAGPTGIGEVYNDINYANRTGLSLSEQVIVQYIPGQENVQYVSGFYLLRLSGLSEFVEFPFIGVSPSVYYQVEQVVIGEDIITFRLTNQDDINYTRILVYDKLDLSLIYDYESDSMDYEFYSDRCLIIETSGTESTLRFIGKQGVETLVINQTSLNYETNDAVDN